MADSLDKGKPVREFYDAINRQDLRVFDRVLSEQVDYTEFGLNETVRGREAFKTYFQNWWKAFPKGNVEIRNLIVSKDQVVVEEIGRGVQSGPFEIQGRKTEPTGQMLEFHFCKIFNIKDGLIVSGRSYSDCYKLLEATAKERRVA